jgi:hypothetical protein
LLLRRWDRRNYRQPQHHHDCGGGEDLKEGEHGASVRMSLRFNAEETIKFPTAPAKPTEPQSNATQESHLPQASNIAINQRERV